MKNTLFKSELEKNFFQIINTIVISYEDGETSIQDILEAAATELNLTDDTIAWFVEMHDTIGALEAGIPLSVIQGKTKLRDHFSQDYIDYKTGKENK